MVYVFICNYVYIHTHTQRHTHTHTTHTRTYPQNLPNAASTHHTYPPSLGKAEDSSAVIRPTGKHQINGRMHRPMRLYSGPAAFNSPSVPSGPPLTLKKRSAASLKTPIFGLSEPSADELFFISFSPTSGQSAPADGEGTFFISSQAARRNASSSVREQFPQLSRHPSHAPRLLSASPLFPSSSLIPAVSLHPSHTPRLLSALPIFPLHPCRC